MKSILNLQSSGNKNAGSTTRESCIDIMKSYLERLELDISSLSIIHVAGTKGKGSTCAMVERILRQHGFKTALFTSPHLVSVCERFRLNGKPVDEELFLSHFHRVSDRLGQDNPGFFRFLTLIAFQMFTEFKPDVVILEVGLGGRLDATNVIQHPVVCGITTLDLDHVHVLGNTIDRIAFEKAGIFKPGTPAFTVQQEKPAMEELIKVAKEIGTELSIVPSLETFETPSTKAHLSLKGSYQKTNAALALVLANVWMKKVPLLTPECRNALENCHWPGRSQIVVDSESNCSFFLDGAHTPKSMVCCVDWFTPATRDESKALILYCSHDRDITQILQPLLEIEFNTVLFCPIECAKPSSVKMPNAKEILDSASDVELREDNKHIQWQLILSQVWKAMSPQSSCDVLVRDSIAESVEYLRSRGETTSVLVTGSLYMVGGVLGALNYNFARS